MSRKYSLKQDHNDNRDYVFMASPTRQALPTKVDYRPQMPPVFDQGQLGSCTANAGCGLNQYYRLIKGDATQLSRLYLYYKERQIEGTVNEDSGAMIRDLMKSMVTYGVCPEADFPYDITKFTVHPTAKAETDAAAYKLTEYHRVMSLTSLRGALAQGHPVVFGMVVYESFESEEVARTGNVPVPKVGNEQQLGGHALLAVGYDDTKKVVIVRNSWGAGWGDKGYCYIPYTMFSSQTFVTDMWTGK